MIYHEKDERKMKTSTKNQKKKKKPSFKSCFPQGTRSSANKACIQSKVTSDQASLSKSQIQA